MGIIDSMNKFKWFIYLSVSRKVADEVQIEISGGNQGEELEKSSS